MVAERLKALLLRPAMPPETRLRLHAEDAIDDGDWFSEYPGSRDW